MAGPKILLVEDDFAVRSLARRALENSGYQVVEAATGDEALRICKDRAAEIDLLLSDVVLPGGVNGCELADQLLGQMPALKVLLVSGYSPGVIGNGPNLLEQHHGFFLQKPFPPQVLVSTPCGVVWTARRRKSPPRPRYLNWPAAGVIPRSCFPALFQIRLLRRFDIRQLRDEITHMNERELYESSFDSVNDRVRRQSAGASAAV